MARRLHLNYAETYAILSAYGVKLGHQYSDNFGGDQEDSYSWTYLGYETNLPLDTTLSLHYGQVDYKDNVLVSNSGNTRSRYNEWEAKVSKELLKLSWSLAYVDTDISDSECANFLGFDDVCEATVVASVGKSF